MFRLQLWYNDGPKAMTAVTMAVTAHDTFTLESDPLCCNYGFLFFYIFIFSSRVSSAAKSNPSHIAYTFTYAHTHTACLWPILNIRSRCKSVAFGVCCANYFEYTS